MFRKLLAPAVMLAFALLILFASVFRTSQVVYVFGQSPTPTPSVSPKVEVNYFIPYAGKVTPDHLLWPLKAVRDKFWLVTTFDSVKKVEVYLLLADKRIVMAQELMGEGNYELAVSTATKAEKYLESAVNEEGEARSKAKDTGEVLDKLSMATLKHREILEDILSKSPEDAKPVIVTTIDLNKKLFEETKTGLKEVGRPVPESPFED